MISLLIAGGFAYLIVTDTSVTLYTATAKTDSYAFPPDSTLYPFVSAETEEPIDDSASSLAPVTVAKLPISDDHKRVLNKILDIQNSTLLLLQSNFGGRGANAYSNTDMDRILKIVYGSNDRTNDRVRDSVRDLADGGVFTNPSLTNLTVTGMTTFNDPLTIAQTSAPTTSTDKLYNLAGDLYWAGSLVGGGSVGNWSTDGTDAWRAMGNVGIGIVNPTETLHIRTQDRGFDSSFLDQGVGIRYPLSVEAQDAFLALVSSPEGGHGSGINFIESTSGVVAHSWAMLTTTSNHSTLPSGFEILAGNNKNYVSNAQRFFINYSGDMSGIGRTLLFDKSWGDSLTNFGVVGDDARIRSVSSDGGVWGSAFTFDQMDSSNAIDFENTWGIVRQTNGDGSGNGSLNFTYGTSVDPAVNARIMTMLLNGNVGIGTTAPSGRLHVRGGTIEFDPGGGADLTRAFNFNVDGDNYGKILLPAGSNGAMAFWTGVANSASERLRITNSGNVGIGTIAPQTRLQVAGVISPSADNTYTLGSATYRFSEVYAANGVINTSDIRLKHDPQTLTYGLDTILALEPISYTWVDQPTQGTRFGLSAQHVRDLIPEIVAEGADPDRTLGIRYTELIPIIINAIQELATKVATLAQGVFENDIHAGRDLRADGRLCLEDLCITRDDLAAILEGQAGQGSTPAPTVEPTPEEDATTPDEEVTEPDDTDSATDEVGLAAEDELAEEPPSDELEPADVEESTEAPAPDQDEPIEPSSPHTQPTEA